ncbi:MAG: class I SAM-dependent methyltransferase [Candidatus Acidiferrales bacterium]
MLSTELAFPNFKTSRIIMGYAGANSVVVNDAFVYSGTELDAMAEARNYCRWILDFFLPYLGERIVEIGAGTGTFSQLLLDADRTADLVLFEAAANLFPPLRKRFAEDPRVHVHFGSFEPSVLREPVDSIVLVNVLEHVLDDAALLLQIQRSLRPGGSLLLFVPALQWNYGSLDKAFEHHRRYTKATLRKKLQDASFRVERMRHVNLPGVAAWFFAGKVLRRKTLNPSDVRFYDRWIVPWCSRLESVMEPPMGQSLMVVALK